MRNVGLVLTIPLVLSAVACNVIPIDRGARANGPLCSDEMVRERNDSNRALCQAEKSALLDIAPHPGQQVLPAPPRPVQRAEEVIQKGELPGTDERKTFIGIAISGGGSRAANFSLATLLELGNAGLLDEVAAISSVSGGSLTAAYYALYGSDPVWRKAEAEAFDTREKVKAHFRSDLQNEWTGRWLWPPNIFQYWLTPYDRSDIMKGVIDEFLAIPPNATMAAGDHRENRIPFMQLDSECRSPRGCGLPRIFFNATRLDGANFVFSRDRFTDLGSRLDTFPVADAVMASAAFPGGFNKVTLERYRSLVEQRPEAYQTTIRQQSGAGRGPSSRQQFGGAVADELGYDEALEQISDADPRPDEHHPDYEKQRLFVHLMDGGASDNLGVRTIVRTLQATKETVKNCAIFIIDSFADPLDRRWSRTVSSLGIFKNDPRGAGDYFIDSSAVTAFDTLLTNNRENMLRELDYPAERAGFQAAWIAMPLRHRNSLGNDANKELSCHIWHLAAQRLRYMERQACGNDVDARAIARLSSETVTAFRLDSPANHDAKFLQDNLFKAAKCLVNTDEIEPTAPEFTDMRCENPREYSHTAARRPILEIMRGCYRAWGIGKLSTN